LGFRGNTQIGPFREWLFVDGASRGARLCFGVTPRRVQWMTVRVME
jgi:hypothetical protein